jgi:uncharacterized protein (TIGR03066 family)
MKLYSAFTLGALLLIPTGFCRAADENATKIVGKWEITKADNKDLMGAAVEFTKDGKLIIKMKIDDKDVTLEGTYTVEKDKLVTKIKVDDQVNEDTHTITKLTDDALELIDKEKKVTVLKRKK